jgi:hypothetical protein
MARDRYPARISKHEALRIIRETAAESARVFLTHHAEKRLRRRKVTLQQVIECLLKGVIVEGPAPSLKGGWECAMERSVAGDHVKVAVVIDDDGDLIIKTVM